MKITNPKAAAIDVARQVYGDTGFQVTNIHIATMQEDSRPKNSSSGQFWG
jgi:hypothetical protein